MKLLDNIKEILQYGGLSDVEIQSLSNNKPDSNTPINPSKISDVKTPSLGLICVRLEALEARFNRLVFENYNSDKGY